MNRIREAEVRSRIALFGPRTLSNAGRLVIIGLLLFTVWLSLTLNGRIQQQVDARGDAQSARACVSYGADTVLYEQLLSRPRQPGDDQFRSLLIQSRNAKVSLRRQLNCPDYPPPPVVPSASVPK